MTYDEAIHFLYNQLPAFERQGAGAYKPGLQTSRDLDRLFGHPHQAYRIIHVAGTNGKGSVAHLIAAALQLSGYRVGLYTSPHIVDFRERIRVDGQMIGREAVTDFLQRYLAMGYEGHPTFFELTSTMAFEYFRQQQVDVAVVEVGLGGRLDSTNIVTPVLSVITNISLDHTQFLGSTLAQIAGEKAGIIKPHVPVVIGEAGDAAVHQVFEAKARQEQAPITFADELPLITGSQPNSDCLMLKSQELDIFTCQLGGEYQARNANTVLWALRLLTVKAGLHITRDAVRQAFAHVCQVTGLIGRWQQLREQPRVICDSGHNVGAFRWITRQLSSVPHWRLRMVLGFMADKDVDAVLALLPSDAAYYFTQADSQRAMRSEDLRLKAQAHGLQGTSYPDVMAAYQAALADARSDDLIYVGGSMYVLADLLSNVAP